MKSIIAAVSAFTLLSLGMPVMAKQYGIPEKAPANTPQATHVKKLPPSEPQPLPGGGYLLPIQKMVKLKAVRSPDGKITVIEDETTH